MERSAGEKAGDSVPRDFVPARFSSPLSGKFLAAFSHRFEIRDFLGPFSIPTSINESAIVTPFQTAILLILFYFIFILSSTFFIYFLDLISFRNSTSLLRAAEKRSETRLKYTPRGRNLKLITAPLCWIRREGRLDAR